MPQGGIQEVEGKRSKGKSAFPDPAPVSSERLRRPRRILSVSARILLLGPMAALVLSTGARALAGERSEPFEPQQATGFKRPSRMEFDERLIMGQSLKSGAVYLFERKDSEIQSMLRIRKDYRKELLEPIEPPAP
jgi:hypothetical protein